MISSSLAAALAAALLVAPAAAARTGPTLDARSVAYADLNLRESDDVARFDLRIRRAARDLCGMPSSSDPAGRRKLRTCENAAVARITTARSRAIDAGGSTMLAGR